MSLKYVVAIIRSDVLHALEAKLANLQLQRKGGEPANTPTSSRGII